MRKCFPHVLVLGLILSVPLCAAGQDNNSSSPKWELTGRVTSEVGKPLAGVKVESAVIWEYGETKTNENGIYALTLISNSGNPSMGHIVRFRLSGYKTTTKLIRSLKPTALNMVLIEGRNTWIPSKCDDLPDVDPPLLNPNPLDDRYFGNRMKFPIPEGVKPIISRLYDSVSVVIGFESNPKSELMGWSEGTGGSEVPLDRLIESPNDIQEREIVFGNADRIIGGDFRGRDSKGKKWRTVGMRFEGISYQRVSDKAADFFDSIIDGMCLDH